MTRRTGVACAGTLLGLVLIAQIVTINFYEIGWFGDDTQVLQFAARHRDLPATDVLAFRDHDMRRYRPLLKLLVREVHARRQLDPTWLRRLSSVSLALTVLGAAALARRLGLGAATTAVGLGFFLVHQAVILPLYRNARPEQHFTLLGILALLALERHLSAATPLRRALFMSLAIACLLVALLFSEAAAGLVAVAVAWPFLRTRSITALRTAGPLLVSFAAFLAWYAWIGAPLNDTGRYTVRLGPNVLVNLLLSVAGWACPVSTIRVLDWRRHPEDHFVGLGLAAALTLASIALVALSLAYALRRNREQGRIAAALLASAFLALVPTVATGHVSEINLYPSVLFFCLGSAAAVASLLSAQERCQRACRIAVVGFLAALFLGHVEASIEKIRALGENASRFERLVEELERKAGARDGSRITLLYGSSHRVTSEFVMPIYLVYGRGPQRGYEVDWEFPEDGASRDGAWRVLEDGTLVPGRF